MSFAVQYKKALFEALDGIDLGRVEQAIAWLAEARTKGRTIFVCGNGGSATTASHFATDMLKGASYGRPSRFRILALNDPVPTLLAYANDVDYSAVFVEQLRSFAEPGDVVMGLSGSGNSANVLRTIEHANAVGCRTIGLTGRDGGKLGPIVQLEIRVPTPHMGRIEDGHMLICHIISYHFMESAELHPAAGAGG
jgi:D-sedoheptulose 7-phosphate isomerase